MPFTLAHPAAVLPLRRWLDVTVLSCGAVAPDFEYFARFRMQSEVSHTALGIAVFDLPVALLLYLVLHALVKRPLTDALPTRLALRLRPWVDRPLPPRTLLGVTRLLVAVLVGIASHLAWDAFTHRTGFFVERSMLLSSVFMMPLLGEVAVYRTLQHASTLAGLACIAFAIHRLPAHAAARSAGDMRRRAISRVSFALFVPAAALVAVALRNHSLADAHLARSYGHLIAAGYGGGIVGIVVASLASRFARPRRLAEDERAR